MLSAIAYIHDLHIVHRDIKAENFILSETSLTSPVKMIDFGMATKFEEGAVLTELCGSPHYLSPELIGQKYNHFVDVWAFGVLIYLLMYGHYPYDAKAARDIMIKIVTEPVRWQTKVKLSQDATSFMKRLLQHNPKKRATAKEALNHSWIKLAQNPADNDTEILPEVVRSAHKKVTATRKIIDPKIDELRNEKLKRIEEDYNKGIRHGHRLGETQRQEFMGKPEFLRRENKLTSAPSQQMAVRRISLDRLRKDWKARNGSPASTTDTELSTIMDDAQTDFARKRQRAVSMHNPPRRLSYIGVLSDQEERQFANLYEGKRRHRSAGSQETADLPGATASSAVQERTSSPQGGAAAQE